MKKAIAMTLSLLLLAGLVSMDVSTAYADDKSIEGAVVIPAKDAVFTEGKGISLENK